MLTLLCHLFQIPFTSAHLSAGLGLLGGVTQTFVPNELLVTVPLLATVATIAHSLSPVMAAPGMA